MAKIQNQAVIQKLIDELELYPAKDTIPTELADKILPVFQVNSEQLTIKNPSANVVKEGTKTDSGSATIYTTPATGKFFLCSVALCQSIGAAASAGTTTALIDVIIDGVTVSVAITRGYYNGTTLKTGMCNPICLTFQNPILVDKATAIVLTSGTDGSICDATITGYTDVD